MGVSAWHADTPVESESIQQPGDERVGMVILDRGKAARCAGAGHFRVPMDDTDPPEQREVTGNRNRAHTGKAITLGAGGERRRVGSPDPWMSIWPRSV